MRNRIRADILGRVVVCLIALTLAPVAGFAQEGLVISEFQAFNQSTLADSDREYSDWFEIFNASGETVDLDGYHVTDTPEVLTKWTFPSVVLAPNQSIVVFASGKDRRDPENDLHTNFALEKDGEVIALLAPDGQNVISAFVPFPEQLPDTSYGLAMDWQSFSLVDASSVVRAHVPTDAALGMSWTRLDFDASGWTQGSLAAGFGGTSSIENRINTPIPEMEDVNTSAYLRIEFDLDSPDVVDQLRLSASYDDGFVAFLNGERILSENFEGELTWNSEATRSHSARNAIEYDLTEHIANLVPGRNILAVQLLNVRVDSSDTFFDASLEAVDIRGVFLDQERYFTEPTPGALNVGGATQVAPRPMFSHDDGVFASTQNVEISTDLEGAEIRYTLNGATPTASSTLYDGPVSVAGAALLTARVFHPDYLAGPVDKRTVIIVHSSAQNFSSNIPIAVALTFGRNISQDSPNCEGNYTNGHFVIIEPGENGRARITDEPVLSHKVGFRKRGSSSCGRAKFSFNVETRNAEGDEADSSIFGWPEHADYAMYGPETFDRALIRNPLVYQLSREVGQYAVRTRFVECYLNMGSGPITSNNYHGLYVFMERNKRGEGRVDIDRLRPHHLSEPEISGGWLLKVDRPDGARTISAGGQTMVLVNPKQPPQAQIQWLQGFMGQMALRLDPNTVFDHDGVYVDIQSWIDHHILNMYPMNVDAFRLSGYLFKPRSGPVHMGPVWDYDRTMGSTDGRDSNPVDWTGGGTNFFTFGWYNRLFNGRPPTAGTTRWQQEYVKRWRELRQGPLSTQRIDALIDEMADEVREAAARNFTRWNGVRPRTGPLPLNGTFQGEINHLKNWLSRRGEFIDRNFIPTPDIEPASAVVDSGTQVTISASGNPPIYYTLDGSDPRDDEGQPSANAQLYEGPITITGPVTISARLLDGPRLWSGMITASYLLELPQLAVTEINYNPAAPTVAEDPNDELSVTDFEFVEIQNVGNRTASLRSISFDRATFVFDFDTNSDVTELAPGEVGVVVRDRAGFEARYGDRDVRILGQVVSGTLSNSSEWVRLVAKTGDVLFEVDYDDDWYPETDGEGFTLENVDPFDRSGDLSVPARWRASTAALGSPGIAGEPPSGGLRKPGDADGDGRLSVSDAVAVLRFLFGGSSDALPCGDGLTVGNTTLLDLDDNGAVQSTDAIHLLQFVFRNGPAPALGTDCLRIVGCEDGCAQ